MEPIDALVDSGAMGEFMPIAEARRRGLRKFLCHTRVGGGDNRSVAAVGKTTINLNMGGCMIARPVILLQDCPYKLILGVKFFYEYACDILFSTGCVQFKNASRRHTAATNGQRTIQIERDSTVSHMRNYLTTTHGSKGTCAT
jgi:hypothetical protein